MTDQSNTPAPTGRVLSEADLATLADEFAAAESLLHEDVTGGHRAQRLDTLLASSDDHRRRDPLVKRGSEW
jgi:hypothetical protein